MMAVEKIEHGVNINSSNDVFKENSTKCSHKRDHLLAARLKSMKRVTNFHSIADLIKKDIDTSDVNPLHIADMDLRYPEAVDLRRLPPLSQSGKPSIKRSVAKKRCKKTDNISIAIKKLRTMYKADQIDILEKLFSQTQYPDADTVDVVAKRVGISDSKIKVWFQNKRARCRTKSSDPRLASSSVDSKTGSKPSNWRASLDSQFCYMPGYEHIQADMIRGVYPPINMVAPPASFLLPGLPFFPDIASFVKHGHLPTNR